MKSIFLLFLGCFLFFGSNAQVLINEVSSQNKETIEDEYGDSPDWIELYNGGDAPVNLAGYFLSDKTDDLKKWSFPNQVIDAKGFLLIFASDNDVNDVYLHTNFKLSKDGETLSLSTPDETLVDQIDLPALEEDNSYGRLTNGADEWTFFATPTPEASNNGAVTYAFAEPPIFDLSQAFHDGPFEVNISCNVSNCTIRYTTDGSVPDETDLLYTGALTFDSTVCIRSRAYVDDFRPSPVATKTYFHQREHSLPVMALSTDPLHLWDWEKGIFVKGPDAEEEHPFFGANFWKETEIPMFVEYFKNEQLEKTFQLGAEIHGGSAARTKPMKSLRLFGDRKFGDENIEYPFFDNKPITNFKKLVLRNASGDYNAAHMRDAYLHRYFIDEQLNLDILAYQPIAVYINGQYWGLMNLREKIDRHYLKDNHDIDIDNVDLLEEDTFAISGNFDRYHEMYDFAINNDLSDPLHYEQARSYFDVENLADYFIAQTSVNNTDWPGNNIKYWREQKADSRWRYVLFDLDVSCGFAGWTKADGNSFGSRLEFHPDNTYIVLMKALWKNTDYRHYFINRYADLSNTTFREENFVAEVARSEAMIDSEIERHFAIWGWPGYEVWKNSRIQDLYDFAANRAPFARQYIQEHFELGNQVQLTLNTYPEGAGSIQINSIVPDELPWDGYYFNGVPVHLSIQVNPGFRFKHWQSKQTILTPDQQTEINVNFEEDDQIFAVFETDETQLQVLNVNPIPFFDQVDLEISAADFDQIQLQIYNSAGQLVFNPTQFELHPGLQNIDLDLSELVHGVYWVRIQSDSFSSIRKIIK